MPTQSDMDNLKDRLRECCLRVTPGRMALLALFDRIKKPLTVAELIDQMGPDIDRATVYRNIEHLLSFGVLKKINFGDRKQYYELAAYGRHHHHLTCKFCDKITDVEDCEIPVYDKSLLQKLGFAKINDHSLEFFGICQKCSQGDF